MRTHWAKKCLLTCAAPLSLGLAAAAGCQDMGSLENTGEALLAIQPDGVSFTLEGCRNDGTIMLPNGSGQFICPDAAYTTGNLGKGWNELDLVPHRVTADAGNSAPASQTYTIAVVFDNEDVGHPGYDVLSVPTLNVSHSSASCVAPMVGPATILDPGIGGIDKSIYRLVTITQLKNTTCVYDYYGRLAVGSHLFPGSSLHANLTNENLGTAGIGSKDVSLPVKEIQPQSIHKDMAATQDKTIPWNVTKSPTPASLSFGDTCAPDANFDQPVQIKVEWTKLPEVATGNIQVITHIYATNPAHRAITVNVSDLIKSGPNPIAVSLPDVNPYNCPAVNVPANTDMLVCTHMITVPAGTTDLNDVATATYTDLVTGVPVPGTTTATASATVQPSGNVLNSSATISDSESITGNYLSFLINSVSGVAGSFSNYDISTHPLTTGPVDWSSGSQSTSGSTTFNKVVHLSQPAIINSGAAALSDTATLLGSNGFTAGPVDASVTITANATVRLKIKKTIPNVLGTGESATFSFQVKDASNVVVATPSISFSAGQTYGEVTVSGLAPGEYVVSEDPDPAQEWDAQSSQPVSLTLPDHCSNEVSFTNSFGPAIARARKVVGDPALSQPGWHLMLTRTDTAPPTVLEELDTSGSGFDAFATQLEEGVPYQIVEVQQFGFEQVSAVGCSFTVNYPADADGVFDCVLTNRTVPTGQIAPTQTTCQDYISGTADDLNKITYGVKAGKINNTAPGVFFYFTAFKAPASDFDILVKQYNDHGTFPNFAVQNALQVRLYNADCSTSVLGTVVSTANGQALIHVHGASVGQEFVASVKYATSSVVGQNVPSPTTVHYTYETYADNVKVDSNRNGLDLAKK